MCLTLNKNSRNDTARLIKSLRKSKKPLIAYKVLLYNRTFNNLFSPYKNTTISIGENISNRSTREAFKTPCELLRDPTFNIVPKPFPVSVLVNIPKSSLYPFRPQIMSAREKEDGKIIYGFHFFLNLEDANNFEDSENNVINGRFGEKEVVFQSQCPNAHAITVRCIIKPNDIIAVGDWFHLVRDKTPKDSIVCNKFTIDPLLNGNEHLYRFMLEYEERLCRNKVKSFIFPNVTPVTPDSDGKVGKVGKATIHDYNESFYSLKR